MTKEHPTMGKVTVGLGWDMAKSGQSIDVDASILMIKSGTSREDQIIKRDYLVWVNVRKYTTSRLNMKQFITEKNFQ